MDVSTCDEVHCAVIKHTSERKAHQKQTGMQGRRQHGTLSEQSESTAPWAPTATRHAAAQRASLRARSRRHQALPGAVHRRSHLGQLLGAMPRAAPRRRSRCGQLLGALLLGQRRHGLEGGVRGGYHQLEHGLRGGRAPGCRCGARGGCDARPGTRGQPHARASPRRRAPTGAEVPSKSARRPPTSTALPPSKPADAAPMVRAPRGPAPSPRWPGMRPPAPAAAAPRCGRPAAGWTRRPPARAPRTRALRGEAGEPGTNSGEPTSLFTRPAAPPSLGKHPVPPSPAAPSAAHAPSRSSVVCSTHTCVSMPTISTCRVARHGVCRLGAAGLCGRPARSRSRQAAASAHARRRASEQASSARTPAPPHRGEPGHAPPS